MRTLVQLRLLNAFVESHVMPFSYNYDQALILEPHKIKKQEEESRIYLMDNQKKAQRLLLRAKWRQIKGYLCGERGPWKSRLV